MNTMTKLTIIGGEIAVAVMVIYAGTFGYTGAVHATGYSAEA